MPEQPPIGFSISWIARMLRTRFDARAKALGLTQAQWRAIAAIGFSKGATQSEIASKLEVNTVTAGRVIDRLEAAGWVERRPDRDDRRANRLYLQPAATPMLDTLGDLGRDEERMALAGFTAEDRAMLAHLLQRVIANMVAAEKPVASRPDGDAALT